MYGAALGAPLLLPWQIRWDDVALYESWGRKLCAGLTPYLDFAVEYPPGGLAPVAAAALLAAVGGHFHFFFIAWAWAADTAVRLWLLPRKMTMGGQQALYTALCLPLYAVHLTRLDVFAAACATLALGGLGRSPQAWLPWLWLSAGMLIKLYPVIFVVPMVVYARRRGIRLPAVAVRAGLFGVVALAAQGGAACWAGPQSLDWATYHKDRGLQVSTAYMAWHLITTGVGAPVGHTFRYGAFEVTEAWATRACAAAPYLMVSGFVLTLACMAPRLRQAVDLYRTALALTLALVLTAKVFSPQYVMWLVPLTLLSVTQKGRRRGPALYGLILAAALLTGMVYPGETLMLGGQAKRQWALIGRTAALLAAWLTLLWDAVRTPGCALTPASSKLVNNHSSKSPLGVPHAHR